VSAEKNGVLASGILSEANVVFGLTTSELVSVVIASLAIWTPILFLIGHFIFGKVMVTVGFVLVFTLVSTVIGGKRMQSVKRGKPEGHYKQMLNIRLSKTKLVGCKFIQLDGKLTLGRTKKVIRESRLV